MDIDKLLRPMSERQYEMVPVDKITVINSRNRGEIQFKENVESINSVGLIKPIVVNRRYFNKTGLYELVFGEGRLIAHQRLGKPEIKAEILDCDRKDALLRSLVENIIRIPPKTISYAREIKRMHDGGMTLREIAIITQRQESLISGLVKLVEQGEERLIIGVERGIFPIGFAIDVARSNDASIQNILMDAFDSNIISGSNISTVRNLLVSRKINIERTPGNNRRPIATMGQLVNEISRVTKEKEQFAREAGIRENRLYYLLQSISNLMTDDEFKQLLEREAIGAPPALQGKYQFKGFENGTTTDH